ncbi:hypothetical protein DCMF_13090 [Candidatus Formimonas warabiya]|uniref:Uncharacterized protein n=1 Tax=Formimonas warabiya TaxID=1761012 RepID=A0A3G1KT14_FORW1|nr:hypothetical protein DCMF_13090 [Candidatus Formimonas warabiya]
MHKYAKYILVLCILILVAGILFRPSGKLRSPEPGAINYLTAYQEAKEDRVPVFLEFFGRY